MNRDDLKFNLRLPDELRQRLLEAAAENRRSLTAEVLLRLEQSFDPAKQAFSEELQGLQETLEEIRELVKSRKPR